MPRSSMIVVEIGLEADRFAVQRSSRVSVIAFLNWLLQSRTRSKSGGAGGLNDLGRHEVELGIAAIARLESCDFDSRLFHVTCGKRIAI